MSSLPLAAFQRLNAQSSNLYRSVDGMCSGNLRKVSEHLRDYFQPTVFNLNVARRFMLTLFCYTVYYSVVPCPSHLLQLLSGSL